MHAVHNFTFLLPAHNLGDFSHFCEIVFRPEFRHVGCTSLQGPGGHREGADCSLQKQLHQNLRGRARLALRGEEVPVISAPNSGNSPTRARAKLSARQMRDATRRCHGGRWSSRGAVEAGSLGCYAASALFLRRLHVRSPDSAPLRVSIYLCTPKPRSQN